MVPPREWGETVLDLQGYTALRQSFLESAGGSEGHPSLRMRTGDTDGTGRRQRGGACLCLEAGGEAGTQPWQWPGVSDSRACSPGCRAQTSHCVLGALGSFSMTDGNLQGLPCEPGPG